MSKVWKRVSVATFAVLFLGLVMVLVCFFSDKVEAWQATGNPQKVDSIDATDSLTEASLTIDIQAKSLWEPYSYQGFTVAEDLDSLAENIHPNGTSTRVLQNRFIELSTRHNVFLIEYAGSENGDGKAENFYYFYPAVVPFHLAEETVSMHIPVQLTDLSMSPSWFYAGTEEAFYYPSTVTATATADIEEFYEFYDHIASTSVERQGEDTLLVTENANGHTLTLTFAPGENENGAQTVTFTVH